MEGLVFTVKEVDVVSWSGVWEVSPKGVGGYRVSQDGGGRTVTIERRSFGRGSR